MLVHWEDSFHSISSNPIHPWPSPSQRHHLCTVMTKTQLFDSETWVKEFLFKCVNITDKGDSQSYHNEINPF